MANNAIIWHPFPEHQVKSSCFDNREWSLKISKWVKYGNFKAPPPQTWRANDEVLLLFIAVYDKHDNPLTSEEEEQRAIAKIKMLGNIKFIGELGKLDLIHESILHKCIKTVRSRSPRAKQIHESIGEKNTPWHVCSLQLLEKKKRVQLKDMGEDLECLCQIMRTVGPRLDHEKAKVRAPASDNCATSSRGGGGKHITGLLLQEGGREKNIIKQSRFCLLFGCKYSTLLSEPLRSSPSVCLSVPLPSSL